MKFTDKYEGHVIIRADGALFERFTVDDRGRYSAATEAVYWTTRPQSARIFDRVSEALKILAKVQKLSRDGRTAPQVVSIRKIQMAVDVEISESDSGLVRGSAPAAS